MFTQVMHDMHAMHGQAAGGVSHVWHVVVLMTLGAVAWGALYLSGRPARRDNRAARITAEQGTV